VEELKYTLAGLIELVVVSEINNILSQGWVQESKETLVKFKSLKKQK